MNQIMENIKSRRSRREFLGDGVPEEVINGIIEAGRYAPSALNKQPWKFIVITDRSVIKRLSSIIKDKTRGLIRFIPLLRVFVRALRDPQVLGAIKKTVSSGNDTVFYDAPLLILIISDRKKSPYASKDCALAAQNMMLYAHSLRIGSCFIGRADFLMRSGAAKEILGLPPRHVIEAALVFGRSPQSDDNAPHPERKKDNIINWIR